MFHKCEEIQTKVYGKFPEIFRKFSSLHLITKQLDDKRSTYDDVAMRAAGQVDVIEQ
jgi:hypothetical protein